MSACVDHAARARELYLIHKELMHGEATGADVEAFHRLAVPDLQARELLEMLEKLHEVHGRLPQAWSVLIHQLLRAGRIDRAVDLSRQATERFPAVAEIWLDRATACQVEGDHEAETAALQKARSLDPANLEAGRRYAAALGLEGRLSDAAEVIEAVLARHPGDAESLAILAATHLRSGDLDAARTLLEGAVQSEPLFEELWFRLAQLAGTSSEKQKVLRLARNLAVLPTAPPILWVFVAKLETDPATQLSAVDEALHRDKTLEEAWELRAAILSDLGRHEEALAACCPDVFPEPQPPILRARRAWVIAQSGDLETAVREMHLVLQADTSSPWAYLQLADWSWRLKDYGRFCNAAEQLGRLLPDDPLALAYLGHAQVLSYDDEAAANSYRRALRLAPDFTEAEDALFDLEQRQLLFLLRLPRRILRWLHVPLARPRLRHNPVSTRAPDVVPEGTQGERVFVDAQFLATVLKKRSEKVLVRYDDATFADEWIDRDRIST